MAARWGQMHNSGAAQSHTHCLLHGHWSIRSNRMMHINTLSFLSLCIASVTVRWCKCPAWPLKTTCATSSAQHRSVWMGYIRCTTESVKVMQFLSFSIALTNQSEPLNLTLSVKKTLFLCFAHSRPMRCSWAVMFPDRLFTWKSEFGNSHSMHCIQL